MSWQPCLLSNECSHETPNEIKKKTQSTSSSSIPVQNFIASHWKFSRCYNYPLIIHNLKLVITTTFPQYIRMPLTCQYTFSRIFAKQKHWVQLSKCFIPLFRARVFAQVFVQRPCSVRCLAKHHDQQAVYRIWIYTFIFFRGKAGVEEGYVCYEKPAYCMKCVLIK